MSFVYRLTRPVRAFLGRAIIHPYSLIDKAAMLCAADKIGGDYLEFGVFRGHSFSRSYTTLASAFQSRASTGSEYATPEDSKERREIWEKMRFFAFDSYEGLPDLKGIDKQTGDFSKGQYAAGVDEFRGNVAARGVPLDRVICVPGWFDQTCTPETRQRLGITRAAIVWVDCDLYHSTKSVLDFVGPVLQDGTILIFDDWFSYRGNPRRGEQRAFAEWKDTVPGFTFQEYHREGPYRNSFIASQIYDD